MFDYFKNLFDSSDWVLRDACLIILQDIEWFILKNIQFKQPSLAKKIDDRDDRLFYLKSLFNSGNRVLRGSWSIIWNIIQFKQPSLTEYLIDYLKNYSIQATESYVMLVWLCEKFVQFQQPSLAKYLIVYLKKLFNSSNIVLQSTW